MAGPLEIEVNVTGVGAKAIDLARTVLREGIDPALALAASTELAHAVLDAAKESLSPAAEPFSFKIDPPKTDPAAT